METGDPRLRIECTGDTAAVSGEIDAATCGALTAALEADGPGTISCIDLSGVTFMDSSGLRVLIAHQETLADTNRRLEVRDPSRSVRRLMEITGLARDFEITTG